MTDVSDTVYQSVSFLVWPPTPEKYDLNRLRLQIADKDFTLFSLAAQRQRVQETELSLWYRECPKDQTTHCQIFIVVPGMLGLPGFSANRISFIDDLPLVPLPVVLLQLLTNWEHDVENDELELQHARGIRYMLASPHILPLRVERPWREMGLFSNELQQETSARVQRYCLKYPDSTIFWGQIGLPLNFDCELAARVLIRILSGLGMTAAVYGSLATRLYSDTARNPKVSNLIVEQSPSFF